MPSQRVPADYAEALSSGAATVADPGNAGSIQYNLKGFAVCNLVVGASNETRSLEAVTINNYPIGGELTVSLQSTTGGTVTVSGSLDGNVILSTAGDTVIYQVVPTSASTRGWRVIADPASGAAARGFETVTKTSRDDSVLLTSGAVLSKWIEGTPTADANYQLPLVSSLVNAMPGARTGDAFNLTVDNIATTNLKIRMTTNTGWTLVGDMLIGPGQSHTFRVILTGAATATFMAFDSVRDQQFLGTAASGAGLLTAAQVLAGLIDCTGTTYTLTLPSGAALIPAIPNCKNGAVVDVIFNNNASGNVIVAATGDGSNLVEGNATIATTLVRLMRVMVVDVPTTSYIAYMCS